MVIHPDRARGYEGAGGYGLKSLLPKDKQKLRLGALLVVLGRPGRPGQKLPPQLCEEEQAYFGSLGLPRRTRAYPVSLG